VEGPAPGHRRVVAHVEGASRIWGRRGMGHDQSRSM
jgi:hypothetical protein